MPGLIEIIVCVVVIGGVYAASKVKNINIDFKEDKNNDDRI